MYCYHLVEYIEYIFNIVFCDCNIKVNNTIICSRLAQGVRASMAFAIFLSYSLQFYVPIGIVWPALKGYFHSPSSLRNAEFSVRVFLVTLTCNYNNILLLECE